MGMSAHPRYAKSVGSHVRDHKEISGFVVLAASWAQSFLRIPVEEKPIALLAETPLGLFIPIRDAVV